MDFGFKNKEKDVFSIGSLFVLMLIFLQLSSVSFASVNPKIQLDNYTISEVPAQPGHVVALTLYMREIEWDHCAERVSVQLSLGYPFSIQGPDTQYIDRLCLNDGDKGKVTFLLPVDSLAQSGTYQITLSTIYEKNFDKLSQTNTLNVRVGGAPSFVASVAASDPTDIYPGDSSAVTITFQNNGGSTVKSAHVTLSASDGIEVKWAGKTQELGSISPRSSASATFKIEVAKDIKPGNYKLNAVVDYLSENDSSSTSKFSFDIPVKPKADFIATSNARLVGDDNKEITVTMKNTGYEQARNIKVKIQPIFPFSTDGTIRYVDSLKAGESKDLTYVIHIDKDATPGNQLLTLLLDYEDQTTKKFSDSADFQLVVVKKSIEQDLMGYWYVFAIVALALAMMILRKLKSRPG